MSYPWIGFNSDTLHRLIASLFSASFSHSFLPSSTELIPNIHEKKVTKINVNPNAVGWLGGGQPQHQSLKGKNSF